MFQFPGFPCISYVFTYTYPWFSWMGFPIRISADRRIFASPRRFSQLITSFFGFQCQGIHHALFFAWPSRHIALCLMAYSIFRLLWFVFVILFRITGSMSWYFINLFSVCSFQGTFSGVVCLLRLFWLSEQSSHSKIFFTIWLLFSFFINLAATYLPIPLPA